VSDDDEEFREYELLWGIDRTINRSLLPLAGVSVGVALREAFRRASALDANPEVFEERVELRTMIRANRRRVSRRAVLEIIYGRWNKELIDALAHFKPPSSEKRALIDDLLATHSKTCAWSSRTSAQTRLAWALRPRRRKRPRPPSPSTRTNPPPSTGDPSPSSATSASTAADTRNAASTTWLSEEALAQGMAYFERQRAEELRRGRVRRIRRRRGWLTSRLLHAFAFRPDAFDPPLYRHRRLSQGSRHRHLHIPNEYLRSVLDALLVVIRERYLPDDLPGWVFGLGQQTIFDNARAHVERQVIASFDLRDFFPSVGVAELVRTFATHSPLLERPRAADARVLLARLTTHRGRLPQGSPTSPFLASYVFLDFDRRIQAALGPEVTYTRYFDDITVSLSPGQARRLAQRLRRETKRSRAPASVRRGSRQPVPDIATPRGFRRYAEETLQEVLRGSSFRLNSRKSRCGSTMTQCGFEVTGITVSSGRYTVPRRKRRQLLRSCYLVRARGWVYAAERGVRREVVEGLREVRARRGAERLPVDGYSLRGRKGSLERLVMGVAPALFGSLRANIVSEGVDAAGEAPAPERLTGYRLERVLHAILRGQAEVRVDGTKVEARGFDDDSVVQLDVLRNAPFFELERLTAARVVLLAHKLAGTRAYLRSAPRDDEAFRGFHELAQVADDAIRLGEVNPAGRRASVRRGLEPGPPVTQHGILGVYLSEMLAARRTFLERSRQQVPEVARDVRSALSVAVGDRPSLQRWLVELADELDRIPLLPAEGGAAPSRRPQPVRRLAQCVAADRLLPYEIQIGKHALRTEETSSVERPTTLQWRVLDAVTTWLGGWGEGQDLQPTVVALERFREVYGAAVRQGLPFQVTDGDLEQGYVLLARPITGPHISASELSTAEALWRQVEQAALELYRITWDAVDTRAFSTLLGGADALVEGARPEFEAAIKRQVLGSDAFSCFALLRDLRNQAAHLRSDKELVMKTRRALCRRIPGINRSRLKSNDLLAISSIEAEELRDVLIDLASAGVEVLHDRIESIPARPLRRGPRQSQGSE